ncbi:hypothetical protein [Xanthomonas arboricola]|uniref:hypothetical protein n=1 Tax=Xanthomonas arboricola TaxID=56448 RepID=UPI001379E6EB
MAVIAIAAPATARAQAAVAFDWFASRGNEAVLAMLLPAMTATRCWPGTTRIPA